jgi:hypothetical protein
MTGETRSLQTTWRTIIPNRSDSRFYSSLRRVGGTLQSATGELAGCAVTVAPVVSRQGARMSKFAIESMSVDAVQEMALFASFDHPVRRFIAHSLSFLTPWPGAIGGLNEPPNSPLPFQQSDEEAKERAGAYADAGQLRAANHYGTKGQAMRRQSFGIMLSMANIDLKWKRLTKQEHFIFCYERLAGHMWRQLLVPCWNEAVRQRLKKGPTQLPLDRRLIEDAAVPNSLERDPPPLFYPTLADADAIGMPLLGML